MILWLYLMRLDDLSLRHLRRHALWWLHGHSLRCSHHDWLLLHRLLIHHLLPLRWLLHHHWLTHWWLLHRWVHLLLRHSLHLHWLSLHHWLTLHHWLPHHLLRNRLLLVHWLWLGGTNLDASRILYDAIWILHDWLLLHRWCTGCWLLRTRNLRLIHKEDRRITRINQSKLLLELLRGKLLS